MPLAPQDATIAVSPSLAGNGLVPRRLAPLHARTVAVTLAAILLAVVAAGMARLLGCLINLVTNLCFFQTWSLVRVSPAHNHLGWWVVPIPILGGLIVGLMARFGSAAIRGHGIPEAMDQVLNHQSRIPLRMTWLKPLSAAISIGTGGPFGAEGPIIASGASLGSVLGQAVRVSPAERKTLLAAGAAAGMAATFGTPVAAVLLAIELLLFEYRARSFIPVCFAAGTAAAMRMIWVGSGPVFGLIQVPPLHDWSILGYALIGLLCGLVAIAVTRSVYTVEALFERLPIHWMWWPMLGGLSVGLVGMVEPRTLGMGYDNISGLLSMHAAGTAVLGLMIWKWLSWSVALGSGTSGGTLAPLFTLGGAFGALTGTALVRLWPATGCDVQLAALVGMAAVFAGASRALLASVVFAFETTQCITGILPLLIGCAGAYLVASWHSSTSIMTEKIARRGGRVVEGMSSAPFDRLTVGGTCTRVVEVLYAESTVADALAMIARFSHTHQAYPVIDMTGEPLGLLRVTELRAAGNDVRLKSLIQGPPALIHEDHTLTEAAEHLHVQRVGRLLVVSSTSPPLLKGILTRTDLVRALAEGRIESQTQEPTLPQLDPRTWRPAS